MTRLRRYVTCTNCSLDVSIDAIGKVLVYHLPDGRRVQVPSDMGWCRNCETIRAMEPVFDAEAIKIDLECLEAQPCPRPSRFRWLPGRRRPESNALEAKHAELQGKLSLVQIRKSGPRCLKCGRTDIQSLAFDTPHRTAGLDHDCGGPLRWNHVDDGITCVLEFSMPIDLDPEGHQLSTHERELREFLKNYDG